MTLKSKNKEIPFLTPCLLLFQYEDGEGGDYDVMILLKYRKKRCLLQYVVRPPSG